MNKSVFKNKYIVCFSILSILLTSMSISATNTNPIYLNLYNLNRYVLSIHPSILGATVSILALTSAMLLALVRNN